MVMSMIRVGLIATLFGFVLTACGGGGSATSPVSTPVATSQQITASTFATPAILNGNFRLARIDYRYDTPANSFNSKGYQTTSFEAVSVMIDQIKAIGFTGVIFQLETPINKDTGKVALNDVPESVKTPPKALWKLVDYAKSQGLKVWISMPPVDSVSDCGLRVDFTKYSEQSMFVNTVNYMMPVVSQAETHYVDGIFIGEGDLYSAQHLQYWVFLINQVKAVFSGKLSYATYLGTDTPIWNYVDYPAVNMNATLSDKPGISDLQSVAKLFLNDAYGQNEVNQIKSIFNSYNKKVILTASYMGADVGVNKVPSTFFDSMIYSFAVSSVAPEEIVNNEDLRNLKMRAFLEVVGLQLSDVVVGTTNTEFAPWLMDKNFSSPSTQNPIYKYWCCGWEISNDTALQKTLNDYFSKPWGYHTLNSLN
jgi:hypothetical protein